MAKERAPEYLVNLFNWICGKRLIVPATKERILVEHCPYCKKERGTKNYQCKDQRFHI